MSKKATNNAAPKNNELVNYFETREIILNVEALFFKPTKSFLYNYSFNFNFHLYKLGCKLFKDTKLRNSILELKKAINKK